MVQRRPRIASSAQDDVDARDGKSPLGSLQNATSCGSGKAIVLLTDLRADAICGVSHLVGCVARNVLSEGGAEHFTARVPHGEQAARLCRTTRQVSIRLFSYQQHNRLRWHREAIGFVDICGRPVLPPQSAKAGCSSVPPAGRGFATTVQDVLPSAPAGSKWVSPFRSCGGDGHRQRCG